MPLDFDLKEGKGRGDNYFFCLAARPRNIRGLQCFDVFFFVVFRWVPDNLTGLIYTRCTKKIHAGLAVICFGA